MSFHSWLQNLRSVLVPRRGRHHHRRRGSLRAASHRPNLEVLEDRLTPSLIGAGGFPVPPPYPAALVTNDFNNDGHLDLATANYDDGTVSVLLGDGLGGFGAAIQSAVGTRPLSLAVADFNNDGHLDLAVITQAVAYDDLTKSMSVLLGNGDGTFRPPVNSATLANAVAAADFNADGHMDLVYTSVGQNGGWGSVVALLGDGQGGFAARHQYQVHTHTPGQLEVADLNADGRPDVVTVNPSTVSVLLGNGDGTLSYNFDSGNFGIGSYAGGETVGDFTGDGIPDLVTTSTDTDGLTYSSEVVNVLPGRGDGTFAARIQNFGGYNSGPLYLAAADFDGDGRLDVVAVDSPSDSAVGGLLLGLGDGTFTYPDQSLSYGGGTAVAVGDFNGDGRPDVAVAGPATNDFGTVGAALNDGNWPGTPPPPPPAVPSITINDVTITEGNAGTASATFTVTLSVASTDTITVAYATGDSRATAGSDYQAAGGTLTFAPGETSKTVTVLVNGDRLPEPNETFSVNLSSPTNATIADGQGIGTILDDEPRISIKDATVNEGNTGTRPITFTVSLSVAYDVPVTLSYATANNTAMAGSGYKAASGTLTIPAGQTSGTITVQVNGDRLAEANETFFVNLSNPNYGVITDGQGVGTIVDDEPRISINDVSKAEGKKNHATLYTFTVTLSVAYDQAVTLSYRTVDGTAATSDSDYVAQTGTLTFAPGETTKTITIEVKGDSKKESNERFYLDLFGNSSTSLFTKSRGLGTILNDD